MEIKFSRHARRRIKLYKIPEHVITNILSEITYPDGQHEILKSLLDFNYPLKIVFIAESQKITVVTAYPLKKGVKE